MIKCNATSKMIWCILVCSCVDSVWVATAVVPYLHELQLRPNIQVRGAQGCLSSQQKCQVGHTASMAALLIPHSSSIL